MSENGTKSLFLGKVFSYMKKQKIEVIIISLLLLVIIALQVVGCGATADARFLKTNYEASQMFGNDLVEMLEKYKSQEGLSDESVERRSKAIRDWQESCKVAHDAHAKKGD